MIATIAFYLFATLTIAPALFVIFARNPVHSVLWLILAFFNAAGLMLLLGAEFIAMLVVIVYVGAVAVLFLFVVMMLDVDFASLRSGFTRNLPFGLLIALVLLAEIIVAVSAWHVGPMLSNHAVPTASQPNIVALGQLLYSRYLFPFEIAGLILLVAMIGAIVLTHRSRGDTRAQKVWRQVARRPRDAIRNMDPGVGEGMEL
ncbi:MAG: NADH-quinone oxidoreductase subunit J [Pseudomonadota bacterium]